MDLIEVGCALDPLEGKKAIVLAETLSRFRSPSALMLQWQCLSERLRPSPAVATIQINEGRVCLITISAAKRLGPLSTLPSSSFTDAMTTLWLSGQMASSQFHLTLVIRPSRILHQTIVRWVSLGRNSTTQKLLRGINFVLELLNGQRISCLWGCSMLHVCIPCYEETRNKAPFEECHVSVSLGKPYRERPLSGRLCPNRSSRGALIP